MHAEPLQSNLAMIHQLEHRLSSCLDSEAVFIDARICAGGNINDCYHVTLSVDDQAYPFFTKVNCGINNKVLESEMTNLQTMQKLVNTDILPRPICMFDCGSSRVLVLEYLDLKSTLNQSDEKSQAIALSHLHSINADSFGWRTNNHIGTTTQYNRRHLNWADFWLNERLEPQWRAMSQRYGRNELTKLESVIFGNTERILSQHNPKPVLCHGDAWSGNLGVKTSGKGVLYDPACYFGDAETDIALAQLFGGISRHFLQSYDTLIPVAPGRESRLLLYQLYHMLNHINMFGDSYLRGTLDLCHRIQAY